MKANEVCSTAAQLVDGARAAQHGDKLINFQNTADLWNSIIMAKARSQAATYYVMPMLDALDVANMLEALKIARRYSGTHNLDDYVDGAGYASCAGEIAERMLGSANGPANSPTSAQLGPGAASAAASTGAVRQPVDPADPRKDAPANERRESPSGTGRRAAADPNSDAIRLWLHRQGHRPPQPEPGHPRARRPRCPTVSPRGERRNRPTAPKARRTPPARGTAPSSSVDAEYDAIPLSAGPRHKPGCGVGGDVTLARGRRGWNRCRPHRLYRTGSH